MKNSFEQILILFVCLTQGNTANNASSPIFQKVDSAVVSIQHEGGLGSGFIISSDGYILTNGHVIASPTVENEEDPLATAKRITVVLADEMKYPARIIGHCLDPDVALIQITVPYALPTIKTGISSQVKVGQRCYTYGTPLGMKRTLTAGVISNIERIDLDTFTKVIQTDAPINPGNSGGPLFNEKGEVIGINTYKAWGEGLSFTIPIDVAMHLQRQFRQYGRFVRADIPLFLVKELDNDLIQTIGRSKGILVDFVELDSMVYQSGLRAGDVIVSVNNRPVSATTRAELKDFVWLITTLPIDSELSLGIVRNNTAGTWVDKTVKIRVVESEPMVDYGRQLGEIKEIRYDELGLGIKKLTRISFYLYELPFVNGVRVTRLVNGKPGQKCGLNLNDIITHLDGTEISDDRHFQSELESRLQKKQKYILITYRRKNDTHKTALAPSYDLKDKTIAILFPYGNTGENLDLMYRFFISAGADLVLVSENKSIKINETSTINPDFDFTSFPQGKNVSGLLVVDSKDKPEISQLNRLNEIIQNAVTRNLVIGAVGSTPELVVRADLKLKEKKITIAPEFAQSIIDLKVNYTGEDNVSDDKLVTSTGFDTNIIKSFLLIYKTALLRDTK